MGNCLSSGEPDLGPDAFKIVVVLTDGSSKASVKVAPKETIGTVAARVAAKDPKCGAETKLRLARNFQGMSLILDEESTVQSSGLQPEEQLIAQKATDSSVPELSSVVAGDEESIRALGAESSIKKVF